MPGNGYDIDFIKKQYLCCTPIQKFRFPLLGKDSDQPLDYDMQIEIYRSIIEDSIAARFPPRLSYRKAFFRHLIEKIEKSGEDVYDKLYESLSDCMILEDTADSTHYRQFLMGAEASLDRLIIKESTNLISEGTTGLRTWQAGVALAEWSNANKKHLNGKFVLELGSGVGFTGVSVIATCSPEKYVFTDCHTSVLEMLLKNVQLNFEENPAVREVNWSEESYKTKFRDTDIEIKNLLWSRVYSYELETGQKYPDVVLAADVVYDESIFDDFIKALKFFTEKSNALAIVASTVRNEDTLAAFIKKLDFYGLWYTEETVPKANLFLQVDDSPVRIFRITNK